MSSRQLYHYYSIFSVNGETKANHRLWLAKARYVHMYVCCQLMLIG